MDTVETVEIVDGVRARLTGAPSVIETEGVSDSIVDGGEGVAACVDGVAPLVGVESVVGVGVTDVVGEDGDDGVSEGSGSERGDVRGVRTSLRGVGLVSKLAEGCDALGRMNDVSKLISGPSGTPLEIAVDGARTEDSYDRSVSAHWEGCIEAARTPGEDSGGSDETVIVGVSVCTGGGEGGEIAVGVTDDSVGLEMESEVAEGSDGAEICTEEVDADRTGEMDVDSTDVGGEMRCPKLPLREESVEVGLFELGSGTSRGSTSSEIVGTSDGGDITLSTSGSGSGSITGSGSSSSVGVSMGSSTSTSSGPSSSSSPSSDSSSSGSSSSSSSSSSSPSSVITSSSSSSSDSSSRTGLTFCPQRHSAVP